MSININEPAAWSDEANRKGLQAWRDAEAALVARRSPSERAAQPLDSEREHLAALEAEVDLAVLDRLEAAQALWEALPRESDNAPGAPKRTPSASIIAEAHAAYARADDLERLARGAETDFRLAMSRAGQARALKVSTGDAR